VADGRREEIMNKKRMILWLIGVMVFSINYELCAQTKNARWGKTITLPNGEIVLDMRGEWEKTTKYKGMCSVIKINTDIVTINQDNIKFEAVINKSNEWHRAGLKIIIGELDINGINWVEGNRAEVG
jgi:hypothetical protein